ncbi:MAG: DUF262 domain-containing protein [Desulfobacterales bacterium]|nr:DUF262 domain-containing protein [Desulfobacterales bacterium]
MAKNKKITETDKAEAEEQIIKEKIPIVYDTREYPVETIVKMYKNQEWTVPKYSREFVWREDKQSKFIESVLLDLPIPYLFLADEPKTGKLEIIDGLQRIKTLEAFLNNALVLEGLKKLEKLNDFTYNDLPPSRQRRFGRKTIRSVELTENAYWFVRKDLFERINTKPYDLTQMEIRKGLIDEKLYNFFNSCSESVLFKKLCPISGKRLKREEGTEMVLRYFAYSSNYKNFSHRVDEFLDDYIIELSKDYDINEMQTDFENMLHFVDKYFPMGFKKTETAKSTPRVRFEAIAVGIRLALQKKPDLKPKLIQNWIDSAEFKKHTRSDAANNQLKVVGRFKYVRDKLLGK